MDPQRAVFGRESNQYFVRLKWCVLSTTWSLQAQAKSFVYTNSLKSAPVRFLLTLDESKDARASTQTSLATLEVLKVVAKWKEMTNSVL
jgi:hypothetical protein